MIFIIKLLLKIIIIIAIIIYYLIRKVTFSVPGLPKMEHKIASYV